MGRFNLQHVRDRVQFDAHPRAPLWVLRVDVLHHQLVAVRQLPQPVPEIRRHHARSSAAFGEIHHGVRHAEQFGNLARNFLRPVLAVCRPIVLEEATRLSRRTEPELLLAAHLFLTVGGVGGNSDDREWLHGVDSTSTAPRIPAGGPDTSKPHSSCHQPAGRLVSWGPSDEHMPAGTHIKPR